MLHAVHVGNGMTPRVIVLGVLVFVPSKALRISLAFCRNPGHGNH